MSRMLTMLREGKQEGEVVAVGHPTKKEKDKRRSEKKMHRQ